MKSTQLSYLKVPTKKGVYTIFSSGKIYYKPPGRKRGCILYAKNIRNAPHRVQEIRRRLQCAY